MFSTGSTARWSTPVTRAWVRCSGTRSESLCAEAAEAFRAAGVESYSAGRQPADGPGIFFVDEPSSEVCEFVRGASRNGLERVVVVVPSASALGEHAAWELMVAGASDVFAWDHSACLKGFKIPVRLTPRLGGTRG
jgi:hypothetical protein